VVPLRPVVPLLSGILHVERS
jgi:hypothetical protein